MLKPFKEATVKVSAEAYVTSSAIRPLLYYLTENALEIKPAGGGLGQLMGVARNRTRSDGRYQKFPFRYDTK